MKRVASLTPNSVNAIFRQSKDRLVAMITLLTMDAHVGKEIERTSAPRRRKEISADVLRCVGVLPIAAAIHSAIPSSQPLGNTVHSWLALAESPDGRVLSMLLHRQSSDGDWTIASIIQGETAKRLRRAIAVSAKEGSELWLASIPNLRVLCLARYLEAQLRLQVVQKGLTHLREGALYKIASLQARLAEDEARLTVGRERVHKMKLKRPRLRRNLSASS